MQSFHLYFSSGPKCCKSMTISSTGLTRSHHPTGILGTYEYDGDSNGKPSYKGPGGKFLQFSPQGEWMVNLRYQKLLMLYHEHSLNHL